MWMRRWFVDVVKDAFENVVHVDPSGVGVIVAQLTIAGRAAVAQDPALYGDFVVVVFAPGFAKDHHQRFGQPVKLARR